MKSHRRTKITFAGNDVENDLLSNRNITIPTNLGGILRKAAFSVIAARESGLNLVSVEFPLPVTGGTELDDWPGGIRQKYVTLKPLLQEIMKILKFSSAAMNKIEFLGDYGEEDAVGVWQDNGYQLCCFPTPDSIPYLLRMQKWSDNSTITVLVNSQIFLNAFSKQESKKFLASVTPVYQFATLSMKGVNALQISGLLYRRYPNEFQVVNK